MRRILFIFFLLTLHPIFAQQKKAFIVAVGNYPAESGFKNIHSSNDIPLIKSALLKLGFKYSDIHILIDKEATKKNIISGIRKHLIKEAKPGDIAYFHFSGHGQQVEDKNNDELDGYDESLVPYDAKMEFKKGIYEGENHIIDDSLGILYSQIQKKLGPSGHFLATIDACHSGTSTRGIGSARGTDLPLASPEYKQHFLHQKKDQNLSESAIGNEKNKASMVVFFGSMANQLNFEIVAEDGKNYGALSYAFSKAVNNISANASYQQLFDRIRLIINAQVNNQIPEATGVLAQPVLGGKFLGTPNYFIVKEWIDQNQVVIDAGFLNGITEGTVIGFYKPETRDLSTAAPIITGIVEQASAGSSFVQFNNPVSKDTIEHTWAIVKEDNFGDLQIKLLIDTDSMDQNILKKLADLPFLKIVKSDPDLAFYSQNDKLILVNKNDVIIDEYAKSLTPNDLFYKLKSSITKFGQSQYLRKLSQENSQLNVSFEFIIVSRNGVKIPENLSLDSFTNESGLLNLKIGDQVKLKVTNNGLKACYYTLLDFQPNEKINVLFPRETESPSDYFLNPGTSYVIPTAFKIEAPLGAELFKLIATRNPINLRPLDQRRGLDHNSTASPDPFENLFNQTLLREDTGTRGGKVSNLPAGQVNIFSQQFIISE
ncbi:MAG: caspase family protein [Saprospiraceae bacterium]|jgi:hypothetical protein|nr:caspase family protein [Saprospiraceae bacterium]